ncbi:rCG49775, partial [Rattus norvegicus]
LAKSSPFTAGVSEDSRQHLVDLRLLSCCHKPGTPPLHRDTSGT